MMLYQKGSPAQSLYLIESGGVRIFVLNDTGHEITLESMGRATALGSAPCLTGTSVQPAPWRSKRR